VSDDDTPRPVLRVVRGDPTPEELAALLAVLSVRSRAAAAPTSPTPTSSWNDRSRLVRRPVHPRPGGWRRSALPG
jgi:Acyl-CoA carboxylase epsilon subunit